jgi:hypothetical protein
MSLKLLMKEENIRRINGELKIIISNLDSPPVPMLLRVEEAKPKLPKRLIHFAKKIT